MAYQVVGYGITKVLKDSNNKSWPIFPMIFGIFSLANYCHAGKVMLDIQALKLTATSNMIYDPSLVVNNFTPSQGIRQFIHQEDKFDDMFAQASFYVTVQNRVDQ